jgi:hypothetical protein
MEGDIQPGPVKARNDVQALQAVLVYLSRQNAAEIPGVNIRWQDKILYSEDIADYALTSKLFTSGDWSVGISQGVAPISKTVYRVTAFNSRSRFYWKGSVSADGEVVEENAFRLLSESESLKIAEDLARKIQIPPPRPGGYGH